MNLGERVEGLAGGRGKDKFQKSFEGEKYAFPVTEFEVRDSSKFFPTSGFLESAVGRRLRSTGQHGRNYRNDSDQRSQKRR